MPLTHGTVSGRIYRVTDTLPNAFKEQFERNLARHAFKPIDPERGQLEAIGWVNIRQMLDSRLTLNKVLFGNLILVGLRIDKLTINQKLFRATLMQEIGRVMKEKDKRNLSKEERLVIEDKVRLELIKRTQPNTAVHEMAWHLEEGVVFFGTTGERMNMAFSDLFTETFQVGIEPQYPYLRAQRWAEKQGLGQDLLELLPSPFSPDAPVEVVEIGSEAE
ncbi:MAG TPA: recombination-associated protein RdgC [Candidatus Sumerlaeota bacterium]|nr:MAG: hypothetical protein BWZ08_00748 [candidate division BRC1 bacterium ADurb.BinA292]HOE97688.1 recombination-associated protein RdgC [Candidatus Sumerlaeota bacterium]HPK03695.1 recombination-associated protein RdgC [Candidatus Sumerlaeota bacterium]